MCPSPRDRSSGPRTRQAGMHRLGSVAGIDVTVADSWFLVLGLISVLVAPRIQQVVPGLGGWAYLAAVAVAVLLYVSVLVHEISHAMAARRFDMPVTSINLHFLGGATDIEGEATTAWREFIIAVVGPLTSLAIGGVAWLSLPLFQPGLGRFAVGSLAGANLIVGVLNLVPGLPLDGGRVLQSVVWGVSRRRSLGVTVAGWGGRVAAVAALSWPIVIMPLLNLSPDVVDFLFSVMIAGFLWTGASQSLMMAKVRTKLTTVTARGLARPAVAVPADLPVAEAVRRAQEARAGAVVVVASDGRPAGILSEAAVMSTPAGRRPWMQAGDLSRRLEEGLTMPADIGGESLLRAMQHLPATEYVLLEPDGSVFGVLVSKDVDAAMRVG